MAFFVITSLFYVFGILASALSLTSVWQRKEYRWDRMRSYLQSPEMHDIPLLILFSLISIGIGWLFFVFDNVFRANLYGFLGIVCVGIYHGLRIYRKGVFRPIWTAKALAIVGTTIAIAFLAAFVLRNHPVVALIFATILGCLPLICSGVVGVVNIPFAFHKRSIVTSAFKKRNHLKNLDVIGITGSYGKTSVKHFVSQLLAKRDGVLTTPHHVNTEIGVAQHMLAALSEATRIYIVEMGAYRRGEIAALARLTHPRIGVVTAIGNQHVDVFGSLENIATAKWELIEALGSSGIAVLNADDPTITKKAEHFSGKSIWYSVTKKADVYAHNTTVQATYIETDITFQGSTHHIRIPLLSSGLLSCVVAACATALAVGEKPSAIVQALATVKPYERTMELVPGKSGATIIDDSYSANTQGVINAMQHLQKFPHKDKRIIMVPVIELGSEAPMAHEAIGRIAATTNAPLYVYGHTYEEDMMRGVRSVSSSYSIEFIDDVDHLKEHALKHVTPDTVILLEGRIPDIVRKSLRSY